MQEINLNNVQTDPWILRMIAVHYPNLSRVQWNGAPRMNLSDQYGVNFRPIPPGITELSLNNSHITMDNGDLSDHQSYNLF